MGSSYGLPALAVNQQQPSPIEQYAHIAQLQNLIQGQKTQQLQQQGMQQENQQRAIQLQDQQAQSAAMKDWDGKDLNELPSLILKHGGSAQAVFGMKNNILTYNTNLQKMTKDQLENESTKNDMIAGHIDSVKSLPPEQQPAAFDAAKQDLVQKGYLDPQHAQQLQYQGPDQLAQAEKLYTAHSAQVSDALKSAQEGEATAKGAAATSEAQTAAAKLKFEQSGGMNPDQRELNDYLSKNPGKGPSDFLVWKAQHSPTIMMQGGFGNPGDPLVDMVGQGRVDLQTALQRVPPASKTAFTAQLNAKYPNYNQANFGIEKKVGEEFTSGDAAKSLTAFNTAIEHAKQLSAATDALNNGDVRGLNAIGNQLGYQFGSDKTTNFNVIKNALSGEISKVFKGGGATDAEIEQVQQPFSSANSPQQLKGAIGAAQALMVSKRDALKQQYEEGRQGKPNFGQTSQVKVGDSVSIKGKMMKVTAVHPDGKTFEADPQ